MIVTLTPNPSVDRTVEIGALHRGEVLRATATRIDPGGKGVNVARAIVAQGGTARAVLPTGGPEGALLGRLLDKARVPFVGVPIAGSARMNIAVVEADGTTTKFNEAGPTLSEAEASTLLDAALTAANDATWIVGCGSLPPGAPQNFFASLVRRARHLGLPVAIDSTGAALSEAVEAGPDLIKPNREELEELVGVTLHTIGDVLDAASELVSAGVGMVAVSLGADGALLITDTVAAHARATIAAPRSTVGAGDCMLAGMLQTLSEGAEPASALARGTAWGAAAVRLPGTGVPAASEVRDIHVDLTHTPPRSTQLGR